MNKQKIVLHHLKVIYSEYKVWRIVYQSGVKKLENSITVGTMWKWKTVQRARCRDFYKYRGETVDAQVKVSNAFEYMIQQSWGVNFIYVFTELLWLIFL